MRKKRGAQLDTKKMIDRVKALVPVLIPLFISAFRRADELAMAAGVLLHAAAQAYPPEGAAAGKAGLHDLCGLHRLLCRHPCLPAGVLEY